MTYKHLKIEDRCIIEAMLKNRLSQKDIANVLRVNKWTISREIKNNSVLKNWTNKKIYLAKEAQHKANTKRLRSKYQSMKIQGSLELTNYIISELKRKDANLSPDIIANTWNRLQTQKENHITAESIYKWLNTIWWIKYRKYLLYKNGYKKTKMTKWGKIRDRIMIEERDKNIVIKNRLEQWHFEADLVVSNKWNKWAVLTLIDRKSRYARAFKIGSKNSKNIMKLLASIKDELWIKSITFDNWMEFAKHKILRNIWIDTYFCNAYASWEKWSIENLNRLLRRFFPKWTNFDKITQEQIRSVIDIINNTPRKILGYNKPKNVHF